MNRLFRNARINIIGRKVFPEIAPGIARDRAEIISNSETLKTGIGNSDQCLLVEATTPLEPGAEEHKIFAPRTGRIKDEGPAVETYGLK